MATSPSRSGFSSPSFLTAAAVDDMIACYVGWREDARAVVTAYEEWARALAPDAPLCYLAYQAALDQEQAAAEEYARAVMTTARILARSDPAHSQASQ